jgi:hypothetical protein
VILLSEGWVQTSETLLEQIRESSAEKDKDRLDLVQSMMFSLHALHRSLQGWIDWVNNPDIVSAFNKEELDEMTKKITEFTEAFIKYDVEVTQRGAQKSLRTKKPAQPAERRSLEDIFYV